MLESEIQSKTIRRLRDNGWLVTKINLSSMAGWPDLLAMKDGSVVFIEMKKTGEKPRPLQERCHRMIRDHGGRVIVNDGTNDIIEQIYEIT